MESEMTLKAELMAAVEQYKDSFEEGVSDWSLSDFVSFLILSGGALDLKMIEEAVSGIQEMEEEDESYE